MNRAPTDKHVTNDKTARLSRHMPRLFKQHTGVRKVIHKKISHKSRFLLSQGLENPPKISVVCV
jgi:hypothetical protein